MIPLGVLASARVESAGGGGGFTYLGGGASYVINPDATQTIAGLDFGAANASRILVAAVGLRVSSGRTISGVTIGGVAATIDYRIGSWFNVVAFARAAVPTGTSGDVVITLGGNDLSPAHCALYGAVGTVGLSSTAGHYSDSTLTATASISNSAGTHLIAAAKNSTNSTHSIAWGGDRAPDYAVSGVAPCTFTHLNSASAGPTTFTATATGALYQALGVVAYTIS